ncbi:MAG: tRNA lysidine(34) synthetase TilS [Gammaproteobacteria bacterium]|nr:tRNA lysidine(34) synthetase TilS [Gammaproteobacteria bacterium]
MTLSPQQLLTELPGFSAHKTLWVAYSGGLDSTVLLHALSQLAATGHLKNHLCAIHIHHGLSIHADEWQLACARSAANMAVCFESIAVNAQPKKGESPEATAREVRYQAIAEKMKAGDVLLTGHHQDDQAETVLIQLLRGCGIKGLAAMPATQPFSAGQLNRPLLAYSRRQLQDYAEYHRLSWVEDESNQNSDYDRNYLRNQIIPQLQLRWPSMSATLSRSASHCAESSQLCDELAAQDLRNMGQVDSMTLPVSELLVLNRVRQNNLLRYWISKQGLPLPTSRQLQQITTRLLMARADAMPQVAWPGAEMRRFSGQLYLLLPLPLHEAGQIIEWPAQQPSLVIDSLGLTLQRSELKVAQKYDIQIRFRQGGEEIRLPNKSHHTSLKKLFQKQGVPPWQRNRIPLLYVRGELLEIAGL